MRSRPTWAGFESGEGDADGFGALAAFGDVDDDALALVEVHQPGALQRRGVDEHVLAAAVAHDMPDPLGRIVPLHRPLLLRGRHQRRLIVAATAARAWPRTRGARRR